MRLCTLKAFRSLIYTPGSEPTVDTLRSRVGAGKIPGGRKEDSRYYVDLDEYDRVTQLSNSLELKRKALLASPNLEGLI